MGVEGEEIGRHSQGDQLLQQGRARQVDAVGLQHEAAEPPPPRRRDDREEARVRGGLAARDRQLPARAGPAGLGLQLPLDAREAGGTAAERHEAERAALVAGERGPQKEVGALVALMALGQGGVFRRRGERLEFLQAVELGVSAPDAFAPAMMAAARAVRGHRLELVPLDLLPDEAVAHRAPLGGHAHVVVGIEPRLVEILRREMLQHPSRDAGQGQRAFRQPAEGQMLVQALLVDEHDPDDRRHGLAEGRDPAPVVAGVALRPDIVEAYVVEAESPEIGDVVLHLAESGTAQDRVEGDVPGQAALPPQRDEVPDRRDLALQVAGHPGDEPVLDLGAVAVHGEGHARQARRRQVRAEGGVGQPRPVGADGDLVVAEALGVRDRLEDVGIDGRLAAEEARRGAALLAEVPQFLLDPLERGPGLLRVAVGAAHAEDAAVVAERAEVDLDATRLFGGLHDGGCLGWTIRETSETSFQGMRSASLSQARQSWVTTRSA